MWTLKASRLHSRGKKRFISLNLDNYLWTTKVDLSESSCLGY